MLPRVLTSALAEQLGVSRSRLRTELRNERWTRIAPNVYLTRPEPPRRADWVSAGLLLGGASATVSGWDAVARFGLGGRTPLHPRPLILMRDGRDRVVGGVQLRRSSRPLRWSLTSPLDDLPLIRVAGIERAVADCALLCGSLRDVTALVTAVLQRELCTAEALLTEYGQGPRNGSWALRQALYVGQSGARSVAEADAIAALRTAGVTGFETNARIVDRHGYFVADVDLLWRELRYVVEIDSREHHFPEREWRATMARHARLTRLGYAVEHHAPSVIRADPAGWAAAIRAALASRREFLDSLAG